MSHDCVCEDFNHLKYNKSDGSSINSNHLTFAFSVISESLTSLFTAILKHSHFPELIRDCLLVPIPKRKDNYYYSVRKL